MIWIVVWLPQRIWLHTHRVAQGRQGQWGTVTCYDLRQLQESEGVIDSTGSSRVWEVDVLSLSESGSGSGGKGVLVWAWVPSNWLIVLFDVCSDRSLLKSCAEGRIEFYLRALMNRTTHSRNFSDLDWRTLHYTLGDGMVTVATSVLSPHYGFVADVLFLHLIFHLTILVLDECVVRALQAVDSCRWTHQKLVIILFGYNFIWHSNLLDDINLLRCYWGITSLLPLFLRKSVVKCLSTLKWLLWIIIGREYQLRRWRLKSPRTCFLVKLVLTQQVTVRLLGRLLLWHHGLLQNLDALGAILATLVDWEMLNKTCRLLIAG